MTYASRLQVCIEVVQFIGLSELHTDSNPIFVEILMFL